MKEYLRVLAQAAPSSLQGRNMAREYLQARTLEKLQKMGAFIPLAFQGGTALRFLYGLRRFSEDLDFSWENRNTPYEFQPILTGLKNTFNAEGYAVEVSLNTAHVVQTAFLKFIGLPYELGLSPHRNENLSIKIEVDTNPPAGAKMETSLVRKFVFLNLHHYDRASLFAGKVHALLTRKFTKGRDIYDLAWYLSDPNWPLPNFVFLKNALLQTGWDGEFPDEANWRLLLLDKIDSLEWDRAMTDVGPFLEDPGDIEILTKKNIAGLLKS